MRNMHLFLSHIYLIKPVLNFSVHTFCKTLKGDVMDHRLWLWITSDMEIEYTVKKYICFSPLMVPTKWCSYYTDNSWRDNSREVHHHIHNKRLNVSVEDVIFLEHNHHRSCSSLSCHENRTEVTRPQPVSLLYSQQVQAVVQEWRKNMAQVPLRPSVCPPCITAQTSRTGETTDGSTLHDFTPPPTD